MKISRHKPRPDTRKTMLKTKTKTTSPGALSAQTVRGFKSHRRRAARKGKTALVELADYLHHTLRHLGSVALDIEADAIEAMLPEGLVRLTWAIEEKYNQDYNEDIRSLDAEFGIGGHILEVSLLDEESLSDSLCNEEESAVLSLAGTPHASASDRKTIQRAVKAFGLASQDYDFLRRFVYRAYRLMQEDSWEF
jgi:hypothetical protein